MTRTELKSFGQFQVFTKTAYPDLSRNLENWLILKFVFIHCKTVKVSQNDQIWFQTWFTRVSLMNGTELRISSHFQILTKTADLDLSRNYENWLIMKFAFIHCKTAKVSQNCQIRNMIYTCFLDEWKKLRSFDHFQILTKMSCPDKPLQKSWKLTNFEVYLFWL